MIIGHQRNIDVNWSLNNVWIAWDVAIRQEKLLTLTVIREVEALQLDDRDGSVFNEVNTFNPVVVIRFFQLVIDNLKPILGL